MMEHLHKVTKVSKKQFTKLRSKFKKTFRTKRNRRRALYAGLAVSILILVSILAAQSNARTTEQAEMSQTIETKLERIQELSERYEELKNSHGQLQEERTEIIQERQQLQEEVEKVRKELQAKKERERRIALSQRAEAQEVQAAPRTPSGNCQDWMSQAGISDMVNGYELIMRESGCNPNAVNPTSGACGIAQALPCSKKPGQWNDPVNSMSWMQQYVMNRYGSWAAAVAFHDRNNWY